MFTGEEIGLLWRLIHEAFPAHAEELPDRVALKVTVLHNLKQ